MTKKRSTEDPNQQIGAKYPGLASTKQPKSISVQRPLDSDHKTVTETNLDAPGDTAVSGASKSDKSMPRVPRGGQSTPRHFSGVTPDPAPDQDTVLELPPSPEHRRAKRRRTLLIWTGVGLIILTGGWALLFFSPILAIEKISHEGLDLVAESEAQQRTSQLLGTPLPQVTNRSATKLFEDNPAVEDITVRAEPPHGLVVTVHEHTPVAMSPAGKQYVVFSEQGIQLAEIPSKKAQEFDLPVVASASDVADQEVFDTITEVLGSLPEDLRDRVRVASGASIDSIELELSSGKMVMWGNSEQAEKKTQVLQALLGLDEDQTAEISQYDVSAPDFPVTR